MPPDLHTFSVETAEAGLRLDSYLALRLADHSRSFIAHLIRQALVKVDGKPCKPALKLKPGQCVSLQLPEPAPVDLVPESMHFEVLFEDAEMIVINKAAGVVVHPAAGHTTGTVVNGLLYRCPDLEGIGGERRPGIVHRLDKDTSGALVVAKNSRAHQNLSAQFKDRAIQKKYTALIAGTPSQDHGRIDLPVGRHPHDRKKMSTRNPTGRSAVTLWCVEQRFPGAALLDIDLKTGRTHQIRVHCQAMGHPIIGDTVYGKNKQVQALTRSWPQVWAILRTVTRQMLHARQIMLRHPRTGEEMTFCAPQPDDMAGIICQLQALAADLP
jgi:23S rRNA pseudouridine1911/1915/1917 synthase